MTDREQLHSLINSYSRTVDSGDLQGFAELFTQGEWSVEGSKPSVGAKEVFDTLTAQLIIHSDGTPRTRHVSANIEITLDASGTRAAAERYVTILQKTDSLPLQVIGSADYHDEFAKQDGQWHFTKTIIRRVFMGNMREHIRPPKKSASGS